MARGVKRERVNDVDLDERSVDVIERRRILVLWGGPEHRESLHFADL
jgi:hypothetical protein